MLNEWFVNGVVITAVAVYGSSIWTTFYQVALNYLP